ncbi:hypothetical protein GCM10023198_11380 [Promicromonospora umidemergens]|uniref:Uncharacterized protein n=1 Tax=Promicromonospora umidemergens TaxID=629679 RepID=A0ABP8WRV8_9MICO
MRSTAWPAASTAPLQSGVTEEEGIEEPKAYRQDTPTRHTPPGRGGGGLDDVGTNPQTAPAV